MWRLLDKWNLLSPVTLWQQVIWLKCGLGNTASEKSAGEPFNFMCQLRQFYLFKEIYCVTETIYSCCNVSFKTILVEYENLIFTQLRDHVHSIKILFSQRGRCDTLVFGHSKMQCMKPLWDRLAPLLSFFFFCFGLIYTPRFREFRHSLCIYTRNTNSGITT